MRAPIPALLLAAACGANDPEPAGKVWYADDYAPAFGASFTYVQPGGTTGGPQRALFAGNRQWELFDGADPLTGTPLATWSAELVNDVGLVVDGHTALPESFVQGDAFDHGEIVAIAPLTVAIGTYEEAVSVRLDAGPLTGDAAFVLGTGPVVLTLDGQRWELSAYTPPD